MKCKECGGGLSVTFTQNDRYFYTDEDGKLQEDDNACLFNPPRFIIHCEEDREHDWKPIEKFTRDDINIFEDQLLDDIREKFFKED
ncbi:MAG: hypothetical protein ACTSWJ_10990 [Candidatus Heimdallarchaeaceae archaeon]